MSVRLSAGEAGEGGHCKAHTWFSWLTHLSRTGLNIARMSTWWQWISSGLRVIIICCNFCYLYIVMASVVIMEFGYNVPASLHRDHCRILRAHRLRSENPGGVSVDKVKVPMARILTWPWLASSRHTCGQYIVIDSI